MSELRKAMLSLGRYSRWQLTELRSLSAREFIAYAETALELMEETKWPEM